MTRSAALALGALLLGLCLAASTAAAAAQLPFKADPLQARPASCLSCSGCSTDPCQTNTPGGLLLLTNFWDYSPATGPDDVWTLHGVWPDRCSGGYDASCDSSRNHGDIAGILRGANATDVLDYMNQYWLDIRGNDNSFWSHEWNKHGTCVSTLVPSCYEAYTPNQEVVDFFRTATELHRRYSTYDALAEAGIVPSATKTYALAELQAAVEAKYGHGASFRCRGANLNEAWYYFFTEGRSTSADAFVQTAPLAKDNGCPRTGIRYLPK
ncbi:uncharacterized protein PFL1_01881 [Pseudozyma flocculosa PF-1]|uniref:ribonuclease T2 n=1 Tax=Pseudozyma flocculosa TaxID=84751 RepID=A0A5C3F025_9BASI|nr:uncharacterized protein PFL1_01881 [Pseudozyma flocculosa PF-1]EPQ30355.1 hypothetical protein PFL1_01881 [Pseudozyma flocculosa PF-1]SPO37425.1 related to ribonuclease M [Pseudozyma flocculosa]